MTYRPETPSATNEDFIARNLERLVKQGNLSAKEYKMIRGEMSTVGISPERRSMLQKLFGEDHVRQKTKREALEKENVYIAQELKKVNDDPTLQARAWDEVQEVAKQQISDLAEAQRALYPIQELFEQADREGDKADETTQRETVDQEGIDAARALLSNTVPAQKKGKIGSGSAENQASMAA